MNAQPNHPEILQAVSKTGDLLAQQGVVDVVRLVIAGGVAGLFNGLTRTTADCDVLWSGDEEIWVQIATAAAQVADELGLPSTWLNKDCSIYADCFPLGWGDRVESVGCYGPLEVCRVSRFDLIASKLVSSPSRPQDLADIHDLKPTPEELGLLEKHLDRLASEHLDGHDYDAQRVVLHSLRSEQ